MVLRNVIRTHGKYIYTVYAGGKPLSPFVLCTVHGYCPQADLSRPVVNHRTIIFHKVNGNIVKVLLTIPTRPPELWVVYMYILRVIFIQYLVYNFVSSRINYSHPHTQLSRL